MSAWLAGVLGLGLIGAGLILVARFAPTVRPSRCPIFEDVRKGWAECGGPCTAERPLPCAARDGRA